MPENRENIVELFKAIAESNFDFNKYGITTSEEMKKLLMHLFEKDPEKDLLLMILLIILEIKII